MNGADVMDSNPPEPETYYCAQTPYVPNSRLPTLVYRNVLPRPHNEESTRMFLEGNGWMRAAQGTWEAVPRYHFHPNSHECYAVIGGSSTLLLGVGPLEDEGGGHEVVMRAGDVIVTPAGVAHVSKDSNDGYRYIGVYPKGSAKWKNEYCRDADRCESLRREAEGVAVPDWDPVRGYQGPLCRLWRG